MAYDGVRICQRVRQRGPLPQEKAWHELHTWSKRLGFDVELKVYNFTPCRKFGWTANKMDLYSLRNGKTANLLYSSRAVSRL